MAYLALKLTFGHYMDMASVSKAPPAARRNVARGRIPLQECVPERAIGYKIRR
ncbi:MAG: hypothetical protein KJ749_04455 [Planctomycetes bacterium]|nr:hypothetical protein [Planctomycetota bacterium]